MQTPRGRLHIPSGLGPWNPTRERSPEQIHQSLNADFDRFGGHAGVAQAHKARLLHVAGSAGGEVDTGLVENPVPQSELGFTGRLCQVGPQNEQSEDAGLGRDMSNHGGVQQPRETAVGFAQEIPHGPDIAVDPRLV